MSYRDRSKRTPNVRPVKKIELSEEHTTLRIVIIVVLLALGLTAIGAGLVSMLGMDPGWQTIETSTDTLNCSADFTLNYNLGAGDLSATEENRQISKAYSQATEDAYRIFTSETVEEGVYNVAYLNAHINETITVDPALYTALEIIAAYDNRNVYLAPVYVEYDRIFMADNAEEAAGFDPGQNPALLDYLSQLTAFASDPAMIDLEVLGGNQVRLTVSEAYLSFAETNEIDTFFDFGWMRNAFIADYLANVLTELGFTNGYLASYDGFTRNLDTSDTVFSFNIFDRDGTQIYLPAVMNYTGPSSIIYLRDYPMGETDKLHYYTFDNGSIATVFVDPADGMSKSAVHNLVSYSETAGCAEILMQIAPVFIADAFDSTAVKALTAEGIESIWCNGQKVLHTQADLGLTLSIDVGYTAVHAQ